MRLLFLGNNPLAARVLRWLVEQGEEIVGLVLHPPERRGAGDELLAAVGWSAEQRVRRVFDGSQLRQRETRDTIAELGAELALSVLFGYILEPAFLDLLPRPVVNLHPSLLPYNRGAHPNVWSLVEKTPAGVTLHHIDPGIDTGAILAQKHLPVASIDTAESLYHKLEQAAFELLTESWPALCHDTLEPRPQDPHAGTHHRARDLARLDQLDRHATLRVGTLIDILRARTFPPHDGAWLVDDDGRRVEVRVALRYLDEEDPG